MGASSKDNGLPHLKTRQTRANQLIGSGFDSDSGGAAGLLIGMPFVGRFGEDAALFRLAGQLERAPLFAGSEGGPPHSPRGP